MRFEPVIYADFPAAMPPLNWRVSVSIDTFQPDDPTPYKVFWQRSASVIPELLKNKQRYDLILGCDPTVMSECCADQFFSSDLLNWEERVANAIKAAWTHGELFWHRGPVEPTEMEKLCQYKPCYSRKFSSDDTICGLPVLMRLLTNRARELGFPNGIDVCFKHFGQMTEEG